MKSWTILILAGAVLGCKDAALRAEAERVTAERDSLVAEVLASAALINQINVELAEVPDTSMAMDVATEDALSTAARENEIALAKIRAAITALGEREAEIASARERIRELSTSESKLSTQIDRYRQTIEELRTAAQQREQQYEAIISQQRTMIAQLSSDLDTARAVNADLTRTASVLSDSVSLLSEVTNTVYYAVGTKDELQERGIVVSEGSKFLFFGSKTLQPSRDLDPADFTPIDKTEVTEIPLPRTDKAYRILSRHNPAFLSSPVNDKGDLREVMHIASPQDFWAPSKFLIVVQR
jgi:hypothetical protein